MRRFLYALPLLTGLTRPAMAQVPAAADSLAVKRIVASAGAFRHCVRELAVPTLLVAYGAAAVGHHRPLGLVSSAETQEEIQEEYPRFRSHLDDYLQWGPLAAVAALDACGMRATHAPAGQATRLAASMALMAGVVTTLKYTVREERPDHSALTSFPSGHTATAFAAAEFLHQEFRDHPGIVVSGYTVATAVGTMRLLNNKHWLSDVCAGAGLGILSTKVAYCALNHARWTPRRAARPAHAAVRTLVVPGYIPGGGATLTLAVRL